MDLTGKQEESLKTHAHIVVTAGAGSGKTRVLVERYVRILETEPDTSPKDILALTFTDKASAEMRARIRERIKGLLEDDPTAWTGHLMDLESCDISTIHSFCSRIVRSEPLHCGVDPDFRILTDSDVVMIKNSVISDMLRLDGPVSENLRRLIVDYNTGTVMKMLKDLIFQSSRTSHDISSDQFLEMSLSFLDAAESEKVAGLLSEMDSIRSALSDISDLGIPEGRSDNGVKFVSDIAGLLEAGSSLTGDPEGNMELLRRIARDRKLLVTGTGARRRSGTLGSKAVWGGSFPVLRTRAQVLFDFAFDNADMLKVIRKPDLLDRARERIRDITAVHGSMMEEYGRRKRNQNGLDFDDLIDLSIDLLRNNVNGLLDRIRSRYRHILVDEFQDTDPRQWEILDMLWEGGRNNVLFLVGDPKQSIYGFRSADVRLFSRASDYLSEREDGEVVVLDRNFRSRKEIMDFVNETFVNVMVEKDGRWKVPFDPLGPNRGGGGSITGIGVMGKDRVEHREGIAVARVIKRAVREGWQILDNGVERCVSLSDIAILLPARTGFRHYEEALRSEGVKTRVYKGKGFFERQEIIDVHFLLSFLLNPLDDVSLSSVLKSSFFSLSDEALLRISRASGRTFFRKMKDTGEYGDITALLDRWMDHCRTLPPFQALTMIISESTIHATAGGARGSGNINKLLDWARMESDKSSIHDMRDRLGRLIQEKPTEGEASAEIDEDSVTIMTIHAAKGLEWPMVVVMGMHHTGKVKKGTPINIDPERGLAIRAADDSSGEIISTPSYQAAVESEEERDDEERKRLYYVACTRAKDHLVLSGKVPFSSEQPEEPAGMMRYFIESMDLTSEDFDSGFRELESVRVNLIPVRSDAHGIDIDEEMDDDDLIPMISGGRKADLMGEMGSVKPVPILSPSSHDPHIVGDGDKVEPGLEMGYLSYPDLSGSPSGSTLGDIVHRIMEGVPPDRVMIESGYPEGINDGAYGTISEHVSRLEEQLDELRAEKDLLLEEFDLTEIEIASSASPQGEERYYIGRIDRVLRIRKGGYHVIDFKTGKKREEHSDQIRIYTEMLRNITGEVVNCTILYSGKEPRVDIP